ncbi:MAG TPA: Ig-like domain-containing protein [Longimicrobium sp.]|nr:Ig-like domain-containing protein [Longimicrobium sp.]
MSSTTKTQTTYAARPARSTSFLRRIALPPLLALAACDGGEAPFEPGRAEVAAVEVTAPAPTMTVGARMQLTATARSGSGAALPGVTLAWASSNEAIATVSFSGEVTASAPGQAVIRATGGGRTGETTITVAPPQVASVEIAPAGEILLEPNGSAQLNAVARTAAGAPIFGAPAAWSSSDPNVARVTEDGTVHAGFGGTALVTASIGGRSAQVTVRVRTLIEHVVVLPGGGNSLQPGQSVQLRAVGLTAARDSLVRPAAWASENSGVATVDAAGKVTAHRAGSAVISATMEGVTGRAIVFVAGNTVQQLERVGGQALPARVGTRAFRDEAGVLHEQRVVATGGVFRFLPGTYEQRLTLEVYEGDVRVSTETYEDRGQVLYNAFTGHPMFESTVRPGLEFTGEYLYENGLTTGELAITQRVVGNGPGVVFLFGKR